MEVISEEDFLTKHGASRQDMGEAALHVSHSRISKKVWSKMVKRQFELDRCLCQKRKELRIEYHELVDLGEVRPPGRIERLIELSQGHPDLESTQAAKRILEKTQGG